MTRMKNFKQPTCRNALRNLPDRSHGWFGAALAVMVALVNGW